MIGNPIVGASVIIVMALAAGEDLRHGWYLLLCLSASWQRRGAREAAEPWRRRFRVANVAMGAIWGWAG